MLFNPAANSALSAGATSALLVALARDHLARGRILAGFGVRLLLAAAGIGWAGVRPRDAIAPG